MAAITSTQNGNWSSGSTWVGGVAPQNGDTVTVEHTVNLDVARNLGVSLQAQGWVQPTYSSSTGSAATNLATGTYQLTYTCVSGNGETGAGLTERSLGTITQSVSQPRVTLPAVPSGCTYNIYLTNTGGGSGTEHLYCSLISGTTVDLVGGSWGNTYSSGQATGGTTPYASASGPPATASAGAALAIISSGVLTLNQNLTLKGDLYLGSVTDGLGLTASAGTTLTFDPSSASDRTTAQYAFYCSNTYAEFNGSSGSRCAMLTNRPNGDEARAFMPTGLTSHRNGMRVATDTDFTDLGSTSLFGVKYRDSLASSTTAVNVSHCTFTRSSLLVTCTGTSWDGNATIQSNTFSSSIGTIATGSFGASAEIDLNTTPSSGTRLVDSNSFDLRTSFTCVQTQVSNNVFQDAPGFQTGSWWTASSKFQYNATFRTDLTLSGGALPLYGPCDSCYWYNSHTGNPHGIGPTGNTNVTAYGVTDCVFESPATTGDGEGIIDEGTYPSGSTLLIRGNVFVPASDGSAPFSVFADTGVANLAVTIEHNTTFGHSESTTLGYWNETNNASAGLIASCRANLAANISSATQAYILADDLHNAAVTDVIGVPNGTTLFGAGYNGFYNPGTGTSTVGGVSTSTVGYNGVKISGTYGNGGQIGNHDLTSGGNPNFVDHTRGLASWGQQTQGANGTVAGAIAVLAANPALIAQAGNGLLFWARQGYCITMPTTSV
jgi:hypothetical protein